MVGVFKRVIVFVVKNNIDEWWNYEILFEVMWLWNIIVFYLGCVSIGVFIWLEVNNGWNVIILLILFVVLYLLNFRCFCWVVFLFFVFLLEELVLDINCW